MMVDRHDLELLNQLTKEGDDARRKLAGTMLTFYGAISSGVFVFVTSGQLELSQIERIFLLSFIITSLAIVLVSLLELIIDYTAKVQVGKLHARQIREGNTNKPSFLAPNAAVTFMLKAIPWAIASLILFNIVSIGIYTILRILFA